MARVALSGITKSFARADRPAVERVDLAAEDGELLVLVGPSGCGKSTLLRMIAGLETPTTGRIRIGERDVTDLAPRDRDIAMVFQSYALYPHMTVEQNLAFGLRMRRLPADEIAGRVAEVARDLGLDALLGRLPRQLSGGQQQRVALGRAIVRKPAVFLFDEPLSNLDAKLRGEVRVLIRRLHARLKATMVYVTHDQVEAMTLGDRIVVLDKGVVQQVDTPLALYDRPANLFVAGFLGTPPMSFLRGPAPAGEVLGVRPEDVYVDRGGPLEARVEVIELLGDSKLVHLKLGDEPLIARVEAHVPVAEAEGRRIAFRRGRVHRFDAATGKRLGQGAPSAAMEVEVKA